MTLQERISRLRELLTWITGRTAPLSGVVSEQSLTIQVGCLEEAQAIIRFLLEVKAVLPEMIERISELEQENQRLREWLEGDAERQH